MMVTIVVVLSLMTNVWYEATFEIYIYIPI